MASKAFSEAKAVAPRLAISQSKHFDQGSLFSDSSEILGAHKMDQQPEKDMQEEDENMIFSHVSVSVSSKSKTIKKDKKLWRTSKVINVVTNRLNLQM